MQSSLYLDICAIQRLWRDEGPRVPIIVEQPGFDAWNVCGQPFAVAGRYEHVLPAVQQQDRDRDVGEVVSHGLSMQLSSHHPWLPGGEPVLRAGQEELVELAGPTWSAAAAGVSIDSISLATSSCDAARISSRSLSSFFLAAASSVRNRRVSSTLSWPMPAK